MYRSTYIFLIFIVFSFSKNNNDFDILILNAQKEALKKSKFKYAKGKIETINSQSEWRKMYNSKLIELKKSNKTDTIILSEKYVNNCDGCPADFIEIFSKSEYKNYKLKLEGNKILGYKLEEELSLNNSKTFNSSINGMYLHSDHKQIIEAIRKNININYNPYKYGTELCDDGNWNIYTVLFPDDKVVSIYMRCWFN